MTKVEEAKLLASVEELKEKVKDCEGINKMLEAEILTLKTKPVQVPVSVPEPSSGIKTLNDRVCLLETRVDSLEMKTR